MLCFAFLVFDVGSFAKKRVVGDDSRMTAFPVNLGRRHFFASVRSGWMSHPHAMPCPASLLLPPGFISYPHTSVKGHGLSAYIGFRSQLDV